MGGSIELQSEVNKGSIFRFRAEFELAPEPVGYPWMAAGASGRFRDVHALIASEANAERTVTVHYLNMWGVETEVFTEAAALLDRLKFESPAAIKRLVVLVNEVLPGMSGLSIAQAIKDDTRTRDAPVILMSAVDVTADAVDCTVTKPLRPAQLFEGLLKCSEQEKSLTTLADREVQTVAPIHSSERRATRVLVIEDNTANLTLIRAQLEVLGFAAEFAVNARSGLEALARTHFDLVLMDCEMPEMDGYDATADFRRGAGREGHTTVVALSAHATEAQRNKCLESGMDDQLVKPVKLAVLGKKIDEWTSGASKNAAQAGSIRVDRGVADETLDPTALAEMAQLSKATGQNILLSLAREFDSGLTESEDTIKHAIVRRQHMLDKVGVRIRES
jgi:CheY-like chemotaxis protein